ncbi:MAG TPA: hypothetical protein VJX66_06995 [Amycolatopsis sp.]|nr:hypothetical protein [Amycolatopsis sp.]
MSKVEGTVGLLAIIASWAGPTFIGLAIVGVVILLVLKRNKS